VRKVSDEENLSDLQIILYRCEAGRSSMGISTAKPQQRTATVSRIFENVLFLIDFLLC
jgi:hypothetical protein